jgi:hypothetical protein
MSPDHNFKMSSSTKYALAMLNGTSEQRGIFKKIMVEAQTHQEYHHRMMLKSNQNKDKDAE